MEAGFEAEDARPSRLRTRVPITYAEDDEEDFFATSRKRKAPAKKVEKEPQEKPVREPRPPRQPKEKPEKHHAEHHDPVVKEREITTDETSLFWILRYSKSSITVSCKLLLDSLKLIFKILLGHCGRVD